MTDLKDLPGKWREYGDRVAKAGGSEEITDDRYRVAAELEAALGGRCDADHGCKPYHELSVRAYPDAEGTCSVHGGTMNQPAKEPSR